MDENAILEVTKNSFNDKVLKSNQKVLVDFNADWCGPCQMLKPVLEEFAKDRSDLKIASVNVDDEEELAEEYGVSSIPCLVLFKKGKELKRKIGLVSRSDLEKMVNE